jgi:hypothetical protein
VYKYCTVQGALAGGNFSQTVKLVKMSVVKGLKFKDRNQSQNRTGTVEKYFGSRNWNQAKWHGSPTLVESLHSILVERV